MDKYTRKVFASNIEEIRDELQLTQSEFAIKIGVSPSLISDIERGKGAPSIKTIRVIQEIFNISDQFINTGKGDIFDSD